MSKAVRRNGWWLAVGLLALLAIVLLVNGGAGSAANAYFPSGQAGAGAKQKAQPLENGPAVKPAPLYKTAPSERVTNDPHWRTPNVRANTDTTTYAQQEPAIGVNPLNHLNVVAAQKDERRAP